MRLTAACYLAGVLIGLALTDPPAHGTALACLAFAVAALALPSTRLAGAVLAGFAWAGLAAGTALEQRLPRDLEGESLVIAGAIATFPSARAGDMIFELHSLEVRDRSVGARRMPLRARVAWSAPPAVPRLGDWCELRVRLKRPHDLANPGGSDFERTWLVRHVGASGYVVRHPANHCWSIVGSASLAGLRGGVSRAIDAAIPDPKVAAVIKALAVDDRSALTAAQWEVMRKTGTGHLLAISGLHITLLATWTFFLARFVAGCAFAQRQSYPAVRVAWLASVAAAVAYTAIAGWGVPAQRAAVMVAAAAGAALCRRRVFSWDTLFGALLVLVTRDPLCLLGSGLWLSFCAVATLIWIAGRHSNRGHVVRVAWRTHVALTVALAPLTALLFGEIALTAPLANLIAVPWSNLFVVPLTLLGVVCAGGDGAVAAVLWDSAGRLWQPLWRVLVFLAEHVPTIPAAQRLDIPATVFASCGLCVLALPRAVPGRLLGVLLLAATLLPRQPPLRTGEFRMLLLDVGQGLAVLVQTRRHALLYDAGPRWWQGGDAGESVIVPALRALRVARLDALLISHADLDHVGGAAAVLARLPVARVLAAEALDGAGVAAVTPCRAPARWQVDGVTFRLLHPRATDGGSRNDRSCVLSIRGAHGSALLPGDIEAASEGVLLARHAQALAADVLVVPHHGSNTSSTARFVAAVRPAYALISAGYRNRYGLPQAAVVERYREAGARVLNTAQAGALTLTLARSGVRARGYRETRWGFWQQSEH